MRRGSYIQLQPVPLSETIGAERAPRYIASLITQRIEGRVEEVLDWVNKNHQFSAGQAILRDKFGEGGVLPLGLFLAAIIPTLVVGSCFMLSR